MKDIPIAKISESLLERIITTDYGANSHKVKEKLSEIQSDSEAGKRRISAAILKLANGKETQIDLLIETANKDCRDILSRAEYPMFFEIGFTDMSDQKAEKISSSDWLQYSQWLDRYQ